MFGSILSGVSSLARGAVSAVRAVTKVPVVGTVLKAVPGVGTALTVSSAVSSMVGGGGGSSLPSGGFAGGLPALPGMPGSSPIVGQRKILRNDANVPDALKPWTISKGDLRQYYRSPLKGYVIRYDSKGDPYAVPKHIARQYLGWRPAKKPPLSVGDWQAIQRADRATKKVKRIMTTVARVDKNVNHGKVRIPGKKKGGQ